MNRQRMVRLPRRSLELFLRRVQRELGVAEAQVTICLVSDTEIARMNEAFRKKKGPTDVLSFPAAKRRTRTARTARTVLRLRRVKSGNPSENARGKAAKKAGDVLGDIAIAPATARRNAKIYGRSLPAELQILILHGVLHLLGYDHEADGGEMDRIEKRLRRRLGLA
ncbi:MAG: rRNA maturation RNase YbeY [Acidobacteriota bacterium]|nr:rRNA maturation RNase YbeY [Acidobacteriota bacterium]